MDREKDRLHPIKKYRPLAAGNITGKIAIFVVIILLIFTTLSVIKLGYFFGGIILTYFVITNLYTLGLKNIPILDILIISGNFILRMMAGTTTFPDILTVPYFGLLMGVIIIFLTHKRRSDIKLLGNNAVKHKPVLRFYTKKNNYILRLFAYLITVISLYILYIHGLLLYEIIGLFLQLMATSFVFSNNPEYTSVPHYLFKNKIWLILLFLNILMFLI